MIWLLSRNIFSSSYVNCVKAMICLLKRNIWPLNISIICNFLNLPNNYINLFIYIFIFYLWKIQSLSWRTKQLLCGYLLHVILILYIFVVCITKENCEHPQKFPGQGIYKRRIKDLVCLWLARCSLYSSCWRTLLSLCAFFMSYFYHIFKCSSPSCSLE